MLSESLRLSRVTARKAIDALSREGVIVRRQGLVGERFLSIVLSFDVETPERRREILAAVDRVVDPTRMDPGPLQALRKTGTPYVNSYFEEATRTAAARSFPLFGAFVIGLILFLYRSFRALLAFLLTIAASLALSVGYAGLSGDVITIVSSLVPCQPPK